MSLAKKHISFDIYIFITQLCFIRVVQGNSNIYIYIVIYFMALFGMYFLPCSKNYFQTLALQGMNGQWASLDAELLYDDWRNC